MPLDTLATMCAMAGVVVVAANVVIVIVFVDVVDDASLMYRP